MTRDDFSANVRDEPAFSRDLVKFLLPDRYPVTFIDETCERGYRWSLLEHPVQGAHRAETARPASDLIQPDGRGWVATYLALTLEPRDRCCEGAWFVEGHGCCRVSSSSEACRTESGTEESAP